MTEELKLRLFQAMCEYKKAYGENIAMVCKDNGSTTIKFELPPGESLLPNISEGCPTNFEEFHKSIIKK